MKRLVLLLALLCVAAGQGEQIGEWRVLNGQWEGDGTSLSAASGTIVWVPGAEKAIRVQCRASCSGEDRCFGFFWAWKPDTPEKRCHILFKPGMIQVTNFHRDQTVTLPADIPDDKAFRINLEITPQGVRGVAAQTKILFPTQTENLDNFAIHVGRGKAKLWDIQIKAK